MASLSIFAAVLTQPGAAPAVAPISGGNAESHDGGSHAELTPPPLSLAAVTPRFGEASPAGAAAGPKQSPRLAEPAESTGTLAVSDTPSAFPATLAAAASAGAAASAARDASINDPLPQPAFGRAKMVFEGDFLILAAGALAGPSFEGSKQTVAIPAAAVAGRVRGVGISPRAAGIALNFAPARPGAKLSLSFGPVIRYRSNRSGTIKDPVVASLGKLRGVIESGFNLGVTIKKVLNRHDQLSAGVDLRWDISGRGGGGVIGPSVSYLTPLSRAQVVGLLVSADVANKRFAQYNYSISPAGSAASGLPAYAARGGLKSVSAGIFTARDLDGNLLNGGFAVAVGAMYSRLTGSAAESPITRQRGRRNQWMAGGALAYVL
jgi:MipA family protein